LLRKNNNTNKPTMTSRKMSSTPPANVSSSELSTIWHDGDECWYDLEPSSIEDTIWHDEEECWYDLEPRPIEDMIASSS
jgi:hypothetical protein